MREGFFVCVPIAPHPGVLNTGRILTWRPEVSSVYIRSVGGRMQLLQQIGLISLSSVSLQGGPTGPSEPLLRDFWVKMPPGMWV
jgi:hypothetical protein